MENTAAHTAGASFRVRPAKSGGEYEVKDGESVLDVLLASGVDAPTRAGRGSAASASSAFSPASPTTATTS
ncbi:hypothetical protein [Streptomyces canus]|uniref:hypothetical protein n=1 Tax=Streptomyces canus TaxID=58343 RepID=UPI0030DFC5FD